MTKNKRVSMNKIKDVLRLRYHAALSIRQIATSLNLSTGAVSKYLKRAQQVGLSWPLPGELTDKALNDLLQPPRTAPSTTIEFSEPDFKALQQELKRKGMTLQLLWEEYAQANPKAHYRYSRFTVLYRRWNQKQKLSMRQTHRAGEKLFVDYCGPTVPVINPETGEVRQAQVFVAVMGASSYTYAEATWSQSLPDWIGSNVRCFEFLGGVPEVVVPDNLRSAVTKACRYEPDLNPTYHQLALHYDIAVIPARPYKPKDKAKAEAGVQLVERWILMRLRKQQFFTLAELNLAIKDLLKSLNQRPFKKLPGSRVSQFNAIDRPALRSLPADPFDYREVKKARVHLDYHVEYAGHYYSVPYQLVKEEVTLYVGEKSVQIFFQQQQVALHPRSFQQGGHTTDVKHMAKAHRKHQEWSPTRFMTWAHKIGVKTAEVIDYQLTSRRHPEHGYRACLGLLKLAKQYGDERLEAACQRALYIHAPNYKNIKSILKNGLDRVPLQAEPIDSDTPAQHDNVRGADYYQASMFESH